MYRDRERERGREREREREKTKTKKKKKKKRGASFTLAWPPLHDTPESKRGKRDLREAKGALEA